MKLLKCEVCGSSDLTKKDSLFVCDYCGAKYSVEEVRKMAVQGKVDITGNVSIDTSEKLQKFVKATYDALVEADYEGAIKYAEEALDVDPNNADALLALGYYHNLSDPVNDKGYCNRAEKNKENTLGIIS